MSGDSLDHNTVRKQPQRAPEQDNSIPWWQRPLQKPVSLASLIYYVRRLCQSVSQLEAELGQIALTPAQVEQLSALQLRYFLLLTPRGRVILYNFFVNNCRK